MTEVLKNSAEYARISELAQAYEERAAELARSKPGTLESKIANDFRIIFTSLDAYGRHLLRSPPTSVEEIEKYRKVSENISRFTQANLQLCAIHPAQHLLDELSTDPLNALFSAYTLIEAKLKYSGGLSK